jgi:hydrogenase expression/formation protein HypC
LAGKSKPDEETGSDTFMCLGIPMRIAAIDGYTAHCEARGMGRDVSLFLLQGDDLQAGDYIVAHLGYAVQKITAQEATLAWDLYDQMLAVDRP